MIEELKTWWVFLQPGSRLPADFNNSAPDISLFCRPSLPTAGWSELFRGLVNGIYGVLVCLGWWLEAMPEPGTDFDTLIADVKWVLTTLLALPPPPPEPKKPTSRR